MATPVTMPQLGESVTEGTIVRWLKAEGEDIAKDEPLCEVDTDKVSTELPSPVAGKIEEFLVSEGDTVDVGTNIALVTNAQEDQPPSEEAPPREDAEAPTEEFPAAEDQPEDSEKQRTVAQARDGEQESGEDGHKEVESATTLRRKRSSPVVRRIASEHDVEIGDISGTGIDGRVTRKDIEGYIEERETATTPDLEKAPETSTEPEPERIPVYEGDQIIELTSIRRTIASRMSSSKRDIPHAWTMVEVDVTGLVGLRGKVKEEFEEREGIRLTYLPFIIKAVVEGLKEHPILNSVWDGDRILLRKRVNVGIAMDLEDALIVPVIPDADELNLLGLARKIDEVVKKAREGRLGPDDVAGGTFTVNNPGALGSVVSVPIINHPQAAILSAEAVVKRPVVVDDAIAVRSMMNLEVSFDHRVTDGGVVLRFLNAVKRRLENIGPDMSLG